MTTPLEQFMIAVEVVADRANTMHGPFEDCSHGHGVLMEELEEFNAEVRRKESERDLQRLKGELVDITAVCLRLAELWGMERSYFLDLVLRSPKEGIGNLHATMSYLRTAELQIASVLYGENPHREQAIAMAITAIAGVCCATALDLSRPVEVHP